MHSLPAVCRRLACCLRRLAEQAVRSDREDLNVLLPTRCQLSDTLSQFCKRCMRETQDCKSVFLSPRLSQFFKTGIVA
jgi:hypothetical protein